MANESVLVCRPNQGQSVAFSGCPLDSSGNPQVLVAVPGYVLSIEEGQSFAVSQQPIDYQGLSIAFGTMFSLAMMFWLVGKMASSIKRVI